MVGQPIVPVCDCLTGQFESFPSSAADIDDPMVCQVHGHLGWNGEGRRLFYDTGGNCIVTSCRGDTTSELSPTLSFC